MRVYIATTLDGLRDLHEHSALDGAATAYAATPALLAQLRDLGDEEVEFALSTAAAEASLELLADSGRTSGRRVVVVAEIGAETVAEVPDSPGLVTLSEPVALSRVDAVLADAADVDTAQGSDEELGWFATQELASLLA